MMACTNAIAARKGWQPTETREVCQVCREPMPAGETGRVCGKCRQQVERDIERIWGAA